MTVASLPYNEKAVAFNAAVERGFNTALRTYDKFARPLGLGVRRSNYDDLNYSFEGGVGDALRLKHYDKSLRLLWKAEAQAPFTSFKDCTKEEKLLLQMAERNMNRAEKAELKRVRSDEYKAFLNQHYTQEQKQAIVNILSLIGHGEAYAWMVSTQLMADVKSTGGRAAMTMQVLEEAKHFVVLREILMAFDCEIPRMLSWEYFLLERVVKQKGLEKFFGMNVFVEGLALSLFGLLSSYPGLDFLRMFHLDESRHTGLPHAYFGEFPMSTWEKYNPVAQLRRLSLVLPALPLILSVEKDLAVLGVDVFDFAGSVVRKIVYLAERVGFFVGIPSRVLLPSLNDLFNRYCQATRENHEWRDFFLAETTKGESELAVEHVAFGMKDEAPAAAH